MRTLSLPAIQSIVRRKLFFTVTPAQRSPRLAASPSTSSTSITTRISAGTSRSTQRFAAHSGHWPRNPTITAHATHTPHRPTITATTLALNGASQRTTSLISTTAPPGAGMVAAILVPVRIFALAQAILPCLLSFPTPSVDRRPLTRQLTETLQMPRTWPR
jgi:hypothetical protein